MNVVILTWGSRGDVQPYIALAVALRHAGHTVRIAAPPDRAHAALAAQHGQALEPLGAATTPEEWTQTANAAIATRDPAVSLRIIFERLLLPSLDAMVEQATELVRTADVVVSHFFQLAGRMAAERAGRPWVTGTLVPTQIPTAMRAPGTAGDLGGDVNLERWANAARHLNAALLEPVNAVRARFRLPALDDLAADGYYSPELNLVAASPLLYAPPPDWGDRHRMTGFWFLDPPPGWSPPPDVSDFIAGGPPPVAIAFGSMTSDDSDALTELVIGAVSDAGVRAIVEPGLARIGANARAANVYVTDGVPHAWLLPRVAAFVHHGGIGSVAAALRAGVPSVIVPHVFDQHIWAARCHELGVAGTPLPRTSLTRRDLATAIRRAIDSRAMRSSARRLSAGVAAESGATTAARLLAAHVAGRTPAATAALP